MMASASSMSFISSRANPLGGVILGGPAQRDHRIRPGGFGFGAFGVLDRLAMPASGVRHMLLQ